MTPTPPPLSHFFVYGTLQPGQRNYSLACRHSTPTAQPARLKGYAVYPVASFPGILPTTDPNSTVHGTLFSYPDDPDTLLRVTGDLDRLEGYDPHRPQTDNLYTRQRCTVTTDSGAVEAWVYVWNRDTDTAPIPSGRWKADQARGKW